MIACHATTELPVGKEADQLREDGAALIHEPLSALLAFNLYLFVDEARKSLYSIQDGFNLQLDS